MNGEVFSLDLLTDMVLQNLDIAIITLHVLYCIVQEFVKLIFFWSKSCCDKNFPPSFKKSLFIFALCSY